MPRAGRGCSRQGTPAPPLPRFAARTRVAALEAGSWSAGRGWEKQQFPVPVWQGGSFWERPGLAVCRGQAVSAIDSSDFFSHESAGAPMQGSAVEWIPGKGGRARRDSPQRGLRRGTDRCSLQCPSTVHRPLQASHGVSAPFHRFPGVWGAASCLVGSRHFFVVTETGVLRGRRQQSCKRCQMLRRYEIQC